MVFIIAACRSHPTVEQQNSATCDVLEHLWTYRADDGLDPPSPGVVFCVCLNPRAPGERKLIIGQEVLATTEGLQKELSGVKEEQEAFIFFRGVAPPREIAFQRFDLDGDGRDEVMLTGAGGAGGTSYLIIFRIRENNVEQLFSDTSRFGFKVFDREGNGRYNIANAGFEWESGDLRVMQEKHFALYEMSQGLYITLEVIEAAGFNAILSKLSASFCSPLATNRTVGVLQFYQNKL